MRATSIAMPSSPPNEAIDAHIVTKERNEPIHDFGFEMDVNSNISELCLGIDFSLVLADGVNAIYWPARIRLTFNICD